MTYLSQWFADPLKVGGPSVPTLFLFLGLVIVLLAAWAQIFAHIRDAL